MFYRKKSTPKKPIYAVAGPHVAGKEWGEREGSVTGFVPIGEADQHELREI
ncbi:MAG: hypothetical protein P8K08_14295 [Fuerstiella sp.]|jgi:hypothetical protein|nr:hypothetical protein [Fuerstiella sp.]